MLNRKIKTIINSERSYFIFGLIIVTIYLMPLFFKPLYISLFDVLDSAVPQLKVLAHSGMIFADNNATIPNMMNGLPRAVYGSEFNVMLWLYYFFEPKTAYIINQIIIHYVAYVTAYLLLRRYIITPKKYEDYLILLASSLYFALLPFFSTEGLSIPSLPLATYALLNIRTKHDRWTDWLILILIPFYASFVFVYMFYIILAGIYGIYDIIKNKYINIHFFLALILFGLIFLFVEYRLILITLHPLFVSHRTEFDFFLNSPVMDAYRGAHVFFLNGHHQHLIDLQFKYILPTILMGMILSLSQKKFNKNESMVIWVLIILSYAVNFWSFALTQLYSMPILIIYALSIYLLTKYTRLMPILFLIQIALAGFLFVVTCKCFHFLEFYIPILKELNVSRMAFVQPLIWIILLSIAMKIYENRLKYTRYFIILFMIAQVIMSFNTKEFFNHKMTGYATFSNYYAPHLFKILKTYIKPKNAHVANFGIAPQIALYNGLYTIDGYCTNYPLSYKHKFRKVIKNYLLKNKSTFDVWGSKLYIMQIRGTPDVYSIARGSVFQKILFDTKALCALHTDYIISAYDINISKRKDIQLKKKLMGGRNTWDLYLYKLICSQHKNIKNTQ